MQEIPGMFPARYLLYQGLRFCKKVQPVILIA